MTTFLMLVFTFCVGLMLGYWVASHPGDARALGTKVADALRRIPSLFKRSNT